MLPRHSGFAGAVAGAGAEAGVAPAFFLGAIAETAN